MQDNVYQNLSYSQILELFLSGEVEVLWQSETEDSIGIGNELWDKMPSVNSLRPLFYSQLESCLYWATSIIYESGPEGRELMDLMICLSGSQFSSVRYNVCASLWAFWDIEYTEALIFFLNDRDSKVSFVASSILAKISERDFNYVVKKIELDEYTYLRLQKVIDEVTVAREESTK